MGSEGELPAALQGKDGQPPEVLGLQPSAMVDHVARVDWSLLDHLPGERGGSQQVAIEDLQHILSEVNTHILPFLNDLSPIRTMAGGSVANTIRGLTAGFGVSSGIICACGDDDEGRHFIHNMSYSGVDLSRLRTKKGYTSQCACLVDADGNRTMRPCLASAVKLQANELRREDFRGSKWLILRYAFLNLDQINTAIKIAKQEGVSVSLDLASFEMVRDFRSQLIDLLETGNIDLCFANEDEARELLRGGPKIDPEAALDFLSKHCKWAVVTLGSKGCIAKRGKEVVRVPATGEGHAVDATGAGDLFASGFIYGLVRGLPLEDCCKVGSCSGGSVIRAFGGEVMPENWQWMYKQLNKRLYIVVISMHGLVRGENMELGRDSDTGGQVKYVVELARALAATKGVYRVDLLTRQISSPDVHWTYGEPVEMLTRPMDQDSYDNGDGCGAYIIRLPCGPRDRYMHKESLWPHIPEFVDRALAHITNVARSLGEQHADSIAGNAKPTWPYIIHGHYADAGDVAARLSGLLNVPMVMTGHSLGRNKLEQLVKQGRLSRADVNSIYRIARRIEAEEFCLDAAEMVVTSTRQEIEEQWGLYDGFDVRLERKLRVRRRRGVSCLGRYMPRMVVIPPGMDFSYVNTQELAEGDGDLSSFFGTDRSQSRRDLPPIWSEILRFFTNPHKPMILALSRPDPKKNVTTLLKAFGECHALRELANLTLILGNRDDIEEMHGSSTAVLTAVLKLIDRYDLYGQVAYPKHHKQSDVPEIYCLAAKTKGVFINPALVEPFGLTLIEAAAYGLPVVATKNGGPVDILKALNNGLLVDPHDHNAVSEALLKLVADKSLWLECRKNGLKNIHLFSWPEHCQSYLSHVEHCRMRHPTTGLDLAPRVEEPMSDSLRNVEDLSLQFSVDGADLKPGGDINTSLLEAYHRHYRECMHTAADRTSIPCRRQKICVIAADCYDSSGQMVLTDLSVLVERVMEACGLGGHTGFVFSTGSTLAETMEALRRCKVEPGAFDALICSSGCELYYPWKDLIADGDYIAHVEYRWPGEHVKLSVLRFAKEDGAADEDVTIDQSACSSHCYAYSVRPGAKAQKVDAIRQRLRMRGFRCNLIYTRACTRLNVIPLFSSRAHALRYLSIRWGFDLSKVTVFVGEKGDTDLEELLPGIHKTLILKDFVHHGSERLLRDEESYKREDVVPTESLYIASLAEGHGPQEISSVIERIGEKS